MTPRIPLVSVAYSMQSIRADTAKIAMRTLEAKAWRVLRDGDAYSTRNVIIDTNDPNTGLEVKGWTKTDVLEITGGSDLTEKFEITNAVDLPPGTVLVIDDENPGYLKESTVPYDKRVAGIISGAGGVNAGISLSQKGVFDKGEPVALTGRVYVNATTENGAIEPGDLITTSSLRGFAMKVTDHERAPGAILGKAMSRLQEGEGLVLVLVTLQ